MYSGSLSHWRERIAGLDEKLPLLDGRFAPYIKILGYEGGIGVRSGCFCAQSYVAMLLGREPPALGDWQGENPRLTRSTRPGMVRVSLGLYNTREDVDGLVTMLKRIAAGDYRGRYEPVPETGEYRPVGYEDPMPGYFSLTVRAPASGAVVRRRGV